ncbi:MAG: carboxypeptidase-like regulatory domain-containing protein [Vicinamibacterales bacterium]
MTTRGPTFALFLRHHPYRLLMLMTFVCPISCETKLPTVAEGRLLTISGYIYQRETVQQGEPLLADALITVHHADGSESTVLSDADGFYTISVRPGSVSIMVSKNDYASQGSQFALVHNVVLNFSLTRPPLASTRPNAGDFPPLPANRA